jgi:hypothetical protein
MARNLARRPKRQRDRALLQAINQAYADAPDAQEKKRSRALRAHQRRIVRGR